MKYKFPLKLCIILALLAAVSVVAKYFALPREGIFRFSFENTPIIFAGFAFGPIAGAVVGVIADLVGCIVSQYAPNLVVTLGAATLGAVSGLCSLFCKHMKITGVIKTIVSVGLAHLFGSLIIKTAGISALYDMPYAVVMLWRMLNYLVLGIIDGLVIHLLLKNPAIAKQVKEINQA